MVGATGAVGTVLLGLLSERADVWGEIRLIASPSPAGRTLSVRGERTVVGELTAEAFAGVDVALFAVPDEVAAEWVPVAVGCGAVVVDGSRIFRTDRDVPLVVPELNSHAVRARPRGIVAVPGGTTLAMIVAVGALHSAWGLEELIVSSYEAVSGAGRTGSEALRGQLAAVMAADAAGRLGRAPGDIRRAVADSGGHEGPGRGRHGRAGRETADPADPYVTPVALNVVPFTGQAGEDGWTSEELTVRQETRKVLGLPRLRVTATCVRVPVLTAHSVSVHARFEREVSVAQAHEILSAAPGVVLCDDPEHGEFPTPADVAGTDPVWAGRVRRSLDDPCALELFVCTDNLRKGAALNMAQTAERVLAQRN